RRDDNTIVYPSVWNPQRIMRHQRGPLEYAPDYSQVLLCLPQDEARKLAGDPKAEIVTEAQADAWLLANDDVQRRPELRVTDADRLALIQVELLRRLVAKTEGIPLKDVLSGEDADVLNPDAKVAGVNRVSKKAKGIFGA
ncbi:MAG: hypothetical protein ACYS21_14580, partial [Planctomycetota bacterium]